MRNLEPEDIALFAAIVVALIAAVVDTFLASMLFKVLKVVSLVLSLGLAWQRIRTAKPYWKDVAPEQWKKLSDHDYEVRIPRKEHGRGKTPSSRALSREADGYAQVLLEELVDPEGTVAFRVTVPVALRLEVRK